MTVRGCCRGARRWGKVDLPMTTSNAPHSQPPVPQREPISTEPQRSRWPVWVAAAVVIGLCLLVPLVFLRRPAPSQRTSSEAAEARRQYGLLLQLGAALKQ